MSLLGKADAWELPVGWETNGKCLGIVCLQPAAAGLSLAEHKLSARPLGYTLCASEKLKY